MFLGKKAADRSWYRDLRVYCKNNDLGVTRDQLYLFVTFITVFRQILLQRYCQ